jgi:hypothetical protein
MTEELREFLRRPKMLLRRIEGNNAELENLLSTMLPQAIVYDRDKVQSSPSDPMLNYIERYEEVYSEGMQLLNAYMSACKDVSRVTAALPADQALIVKRRFLNFEDFDTIGQKAHISRRHVFRLYDAAIETLEKMALNGTQ